LRFSGLQDFWRSETDKKTMCLMAAHGFLSVDYDK